MRFLVAAVLASLAFVQAKSHNLNAHQPYGEAALEEMFTSFIKTHNKKYTHDDFFARYHTFKTNVEKIRQHNQKRLSYTMGLNEFADQSWEEFRSTRLGLKKHDREVLRAANVDHSFDEFNPAAPTSVDWRSQGAVTPVKDQGQCGSCWAFSTTGSVEGAYFLAKKTLPNLSEQQLVDCSTAQGNQGCNGGLMDDGFQYIITNKGITSETKYPYKATGPNKCAAAGLPVAATISKFTDVAKTETALLNAVAQQPVSVAIEADQEAFQFYSGGVLTAACGTNLDHGVLAVGYGTDGSNPYWIVKNSWGASWGEQGYIRLVRNKNECGISNMASFPVV